MIDPQEKADCEYGSLEEGCLREPTINVIISNPVTFLALMSANILVLEKGLLMLWLEIMNLPATHTQFKNYLPYFTQLKHTSAASLLP